MPFNPPDDVAMILLYCYSQYYIQQHLVTYNNLKHFGKSLGLNSVINNNFVNEFKPCQYLATLYSIKEVFKVT